MLFFYGAFPKIDQHNPVVNSPLHKLKEGKLYYYKIYNPSYSFYLRKSISKVPNLQKTEGYLITRKKYLKVLDQFEVNYQIMFEGKDLFEPPTTVIVKLSPLSN
ncbi:hypothetical protein QWY93_05765 [Echinicola jeungdonensis]|uniref:Uncharacterized protein n=1 Tax=Echinicola jeungdonensis TaxID=709343 RepID=A0ABV5J4T8_9BACT|nr:hypothetical protein [Echinicola jeungdonensis]MDN3668830.1 hypothetical protein [Echinicola jeungdonensis]